MISELFANYKFGAKHTPNTAADRNNSGMDSDLFREIHPLKFQYVFSYK